MIFLPFLLPILIFGLPDLDRIQHCTICKQEASTVSGVMKALWEKFGARMTKSSIHVTGQTREMTPKERELFDAAFVTFDKGFAAMDEMFEEARRHNKRSKP